MSENIKINVIALFRNSAAHISRTLEQLSNLTSIKGIEFSFFFFENDSKDNTKEILSNWCVLFGGTLVSENYNAPSFGSIDSNIRTSLLAFYRNKIKRIAARTPSNYTLVLDSDLEFTNEDFNELYKVITPKFSNDDIVGVIGSCVQNIPDYTFQQGMESQYDLYCFVDKSGGRGMYFSSSPFVNADDTVNFIGGRPVEVMSGFGGMALYVSWAYNNEGVNYSGESASEHVPLNFALRKFGPIFAVPTCRPRATVDLSTINLEACMKLGLQQAEQYKMVNQLRLLSTDNEYKFKFGKQ